MPQWVARCSTLGIPAGAVILRHTINDPQIERVKVRCGQWRPRLVDCLPKIVKHALDAVGIFSTRMKLYRNLQVLAKSTLSAIRRTYQGELFVRARNPVQLRMKSSGTTKPHDPDSICWIASLQTIQPSEGCGIRTTKIGPDDPIDAAPVAAEVVDSAPELVGQFAFQ